MAAAYLGFIGSVRMDDEGTKRPPFVRWQPQASAALRERAIGKRQGTSTQCQRLRDRLTDPRAAGDYRHFTFWIHFSSPIRY